MANYKDLTGKQFGRLTAIERLPPHGKNEKIQLSWKRIHACRIVSHIRSTTQHGGEPNEERNTARKGVKRKWEVQNEHASVGIVR